MLSSVLGIQQLSDSEKLLMSLIYDENEQLLSSLQLNQLATFTYHERSLTGGRLIHERMLDILEQVISRPVDVSPLAMHKALVIFRHLLLHGAEQVLGPARTLRQYTCIIEEKYNTALIAQQAVGATGLLMRLKGGAVDKGGPSREVAKSINNLLSNPHALQNARSVNADPESLVPVGSHQKVAFITDEARLAILKHRMEQERRVILKSNLAKSDSAFGSGYNSKDGKAIVGAAHSLEEMIKEAEKKEQAAKKRFTDAPKPSQQQQQPGDPYRSSFSDYEAPDSIYSPTLATNATEQDLLSFDTPKVAQSTDFLSFESSNGLAYSAPIGGSSVSAAEVDLLNFQSSAVGTGGHAHTTADLLGSDFAIPSATTTDSTAKAVMFNGTSANGSTSSMQSLHGNTFMSMSSIEQLHMSSSAALSGGSGTGLSSIMPLGTLSQSQDPYTVANGPTSMPLSHGDTFIGMSSMEPSQTSSTHGGASGGSGSGTTSIMSRGTLSQSQDPFAALDALNPMGSIAGSNGLQHQPQKQKGQRQQQQWQVLPTTGMGNTGMMTTSLDSLSMSLSSISLTPSHPPVSSTTTMMAPSALGAASFSRMGAVPPPTNPYHYRETSDSSIGDGFVMGGVIGSGLEPLGSAPATPPPPPPPP